MARQVTERDFRLPEFADAKAEDYEFRSDGKLVRKDRWEQGFRNVVSALNLSSRDFEIPSVVGLVGDLHHTMCILYDHLGIERPDLDSEQHSAVNPYNDIIVAIAERLPKPPVDESVGTQPYDVGYLKEKRPK